MKNHQYIRRLSVRDLAGLLITAEIVTDYDEDIDGEWRECGEYTMYIAPNGSRYGSYEDALKYTIDWLNAEHREEIPS